MASSYIFDNGQINGLDPALFNFKAEEVQKTDFVVTSNLIVHPDGILLWEAGAEMWIGHDKTIHSKLKFAPAFYE